MKKVICLSLIVFLILLTSCAEQTTKTPKQAFFIQTDGYLAAEVDTTYSVAFSLYYALNDPILKAEDISLVKFVGISPDIEVINLQTQDLTVTNGILGGFGLLLELRFNRIGLHETEQITLSIDGETYTLPIGKWVFDIGESEENTYIDTWSSPGVSSNPNLFPYDYILLNSDSKVKQITYAKNGNITDEDGIQLSGNIDLTQTYNAPIKYIKPKMQVSTPDGDVIIYSDTGCYCEAIDYSDDIIDVSKEYTDEYLTKVK